MERSAAQYVFDFQAAQSQAFRLRELEPETQLVLVDPRIPYDFQLANSGMLVDATVIYHPEDDLGKNPRALAVKLVGRSQSDPNVEDTLAAKARAVTSPWRNATPLEGISLDPDWLRSYPAVAFMGGNYRSIVGLSALSRSAHRAVVVERYCQDLRVTQHYKDLKDGLTAVLAVRAV